MPPPSKKTKTQNTAAIKKIDPDSGKFAKLAPVSQPQVAPEIDPRALVKRPDDPTRQARTVFVSNLDFNLKEEDIRAILSSSGTITEIRLVLDFKKRSKGYCYVEFSTEVSRKTNRSLRIHRFKQMLMCCTGGSAGSFKTGPGAYKHSTDVHLPKRTGQFPQNVRIQVPILAGKEETLR